MTTRVLLYGFLCVVLLIGCGDWRQAQFQPKTFSFTEQATLDSLVSVVLDTVSVQNARIDLGERSCDNCTDEQQDLWESVLDRDAKKAGYPEALDKTYQMGLDDAVRDIQQGKLRILYYGGVVFWETHDGETWNPNKVHADILLEQFGVEKERITGSVVNTWQVTYLTAYNRVSEAVINLYYEQEDVMQSTWDMVADAIDERGQRNRRRWK
ncbi:MAG: hypothetical protein KTR29_19985 [Rhodothermaceae bacterium]|nr:hypothetical protein [Rhodothermaceae bacterium]